MNNDRQVRMDQTGSGRALQTTGARALGPCDWSARHESRPLEWRILDRMGDISLDWKTMALICYDTVLICWFGPDVLRWLG